MRTTNEQRPFFRVLLPLVPAALFFGVLFGAQTLFAQISGDGVPPKFSNIQITAPNATTTIITWETDEDADSQVDFGLNKNYGVVRDPFPNKKKHKITLDDLEPSTIYHLRIGSADAGGNQALSGDYLITTKGVVNIKDINNIAPDERVVVERAVLAIRKLKTPAGFKVVADELNEAAQNIIEPPRITGTPSVDGKEVGSDYAVVSWTTDQDSGSVVRYARDIDYKPGSDRPYTTEAGDANERTQIHSVRVVGLTPGTLYHFQVASESGDGLVGESGDGTFTTKAQLPNILSFRLLKVQADSATVEWRTSIPASGIVEYTNTKTKEVKSAGSPVFSVLHQIKVAGLSLGARYTAIVKAENIVGDKVTSNPLSFTTVRDVAPPLISKVSNDSTLYPSADAKVQTIVSWATDEEAYCQLFYREGLNPAVEPTGHGEEKEPRSDHVDVITEFLPSTVYQFWVECRDEARNKTTSEKFVLFTPNKEKSIIDIILENFSGTFGWVKNIGK
jgi:hypothetical protein